MKRQNNTKGMRVAKEMQSEINRVVQYPTKCPYCGSVMSVKPSSYVNSIWDEELLVCNNYPSCDSYCRVKKKKGNYILLSTPADKNLRQMRNEAHLYISLLEENGIYEKISDIYDMLIHRSSFGSHYVKHIGECREYGCNEIITICIEELYRNKERIQHFQFWNDSSSIDEKHKQMLEEICQTIETDECRRPYERFIQGRTYPGVVTNVTEKNIYVRMQGMYDAMCRRIPGKTDMIKKGERVMASVEKKYKDKEFIRVGIWDTKKSS